MASTSASAEERATDPSTPDALGASTSASAALGALAALSALLLARECVDVSSRPAVYLQPQGILPWARPARPQRPPPRPQPRRAAQLALARKRPTSQVRSHAPRRRGRLLQTPLTKGLHMDGRWRLVRPFDRDRSDGGWWMAEIGEVVGLRSRRTRNLRERNGRGKMMRSMNKFEIATVFEIFKNWF